VAEVIFTYSESLLTTACISVISGVDGDNAPCAEIVDTMNAHVCSMHAGQIVMNPCEKEICFVVALRW
jgi:hypothetical protein